METLSNARQLLWDFKELGNREECHIVCRLYAGHFAWRHTLTHSWPFTPSLNAKEQMLCNFLFSTETIASTPFLTRPLSLQPSTTDPWQANMYQGLPLSLSLSLSLSLPQSWVDTQDIKYNLKAINSQTPYAYDATHRDLKFYNSGSVFRTLLLLLFLFCLVFWSAHLSK